MPAKKRRNGGNLTTRILIQIRDEQRGTNARLDRTVECLDRTVEQLGQTNERLDHTIVRLTALERRQAETEIRLATELVAVAQAVHGVRDLLREDLQLRPRLDDHETRLRDLERKLG